MFSSITFHPTPGSPAMLTTTHYTKRPCHVGDGWRALREAMAYNLGCDEDDLDSEECWWGGPDGEDEYVEIVTLNSEIIGSLSRALTVEDLRQINGESNARRAA